MCSILRKFTPNCPEHQLKGIIANIHIKIHCKGYSNSLINNNAHSAATTPCIHNKFNLTSETPGLSDADPDQCQLCYRGTYPEYPGNYELVS